MTNSNSNIAKKIEIRDESIRLGQLLKLADLVPSGSDAKYVLSSGEILVNGTIETRRGRTLRPGDVVTYADVVVEVSARSNI